MNETSRRKLLAVAGAGAAATTVGLTAKSASAAEAKPKAGSAQERVVAVVDNHRGSELVLLVGEREVVINDRDLVTRILNAAGGK